VKPFELVRPTDPRRAAELGSRVGAAFLAGGTTLVDLMKLGIEVPSTLVDLTALPIGEVERLAGGGVRIGALARLSALGRSIAVAERYPALHQAVLASASPQLRNMATVGGNLVQRTRCPYFRDGTSSCNQRAPGSGCAALDGVSRTHAVLGTSDRCIAAHPGDMAVALVALDAVVQTILPDGQTRSLPIDAFFIAYGDAPERPTALDAGELVTAIDLPATGWFARSAYVKVRGRASFDFALASAAVALELSGGTISAARVALGGVATKPWRARAAEECLVGRAPQDEDAVSDAARAALAGARPARDNAFKIELAERVVVSAIAAAAEAGTVPAGATS
jgi:xanthine dehydrogenase YagS FAD-binding subunit